jgi:hypothetical protein
MNELDGGRNWFQGYYMGWREERTDSCWRMVWFEEDPEGAGEVNASGVFI